MPMSEMVPPGFTAPPGFSWFQRLGRDEDDVAVVKSGRGATTADDDDDDDDDAAAAFEESDVSDTSLLSPLIPGS